MMILILLFCFTFIVFTQEHKEAKLTSSYSEAVTKTYILKNVSPEIANRVLRPYFFDSSYDRNSNMFTVRIGKEMIPVFEDLLKQLDVEKRKISLRIFTVIASNDDRRSEIANNDLNRVLNELKRVLSFKSFRLDGVSSLTVNEGQNRSELMLSSQSPLLLRLGDISIKGDRPGRKIAFEFDLIQKIFAGNKEGSNYSTETLIRSESSVKETGYFVAGVSKIGPNGDSLILIINAEIR